MNSNSRQDLSPLESSAASFGISDDLHIDIFESQINSLHADVKKDMSAGKAGKDATLGHLPSRETIADCAKAGEEKVSRGRREELLKKNQSLQAELYMARERNRLLCQKLKDTELGMANPSSKGDSKHKDNSIDSLLERLRQTTQQLITCRNANAVLSKEVKQAVKALELETGESISSLSNWLAKSVNKEAPWRGRQQQICSLTAKIRRLEGDLRLFHPDVPKTETLNGAASDRSSSLGATDLGYELLEPVASCKTTAIVLPRLHSLHSELDSRRHLPNSTGFTSQSAAIKALEEENQTLKDDVSQLRERLKTREARISVLNSYLSEQKEKARLLVEKGAHDHELINSLLQEKEKNFNMAKSAQADRNASEAKLRGEIGRLTSELVKEVQQNKALKMVIERKEELINHLSNSRPGLEDTIQGGRVCDDQQSQIGRKDQHTEASPVYRAVTVERDQLREFIKVLEARGEEMLQEITLKDKEIAELRQRCSQVEHASTELPLKNRRHSSKPLNERLLDPRLASDLLTGIPASSKVKPLINAIHEEYRRSQCQKSGTVTKPDQLLPLPVTL
ncbi:unnamed protein product [Dibothriocephalus latus]|uniref:Uncharacterized protein n=1 Tax=Dibothriocephalus latus TaxID=60516 RepID=A0A3P6TSY8_DIBLA|nr:unnamed protein product [Dibothriocephalus latus]